MGVDLIGEVYVSIRWGRAGRGRDAEELDRFNVEILLDVMDLSQVEIRNALPIEGFLEWHEFG